ncbi:MAG: phytoene desaturase [Deltaproteobacteria bacterium]|nr:phytoene desaturase [Deltaproteobacteria bacterium]
MTKAVVIGAGIGGLSAALALAGAGVEVVVVEAAPRAGGKADTVVLDGVAVDTGPSVLTMPEVFEELFAKAGAKLADEITLTRPEPAFRYVYPDGVVLDVFHELERTEASIAATLGADAAADFRSFLAYSRVIWEAAAPEFVYGPSPTFGSLVMMGPRALAAMTKIDGLGKMLASIDKRVRSHHLRWLFARYATYNGSDPRVAPATLNCIAHVELGLGGFGVAGGIHELIRAMVRVGERRGVVYRFGERVREIRFRGKRVTGVLTDTGSLDADLVVANTEAAHLYRDLATSLGSGPKDETPSTSGLNVIVRARASTARVAHTVLFPDEYADEFRDLFDAKRAPVAPTVYLCDQSRCHDVRGWGDGVPVFLMANAPALASDGEERTEEWQRVAHELVVRSQRAGLLDDGATVLWSRTPAELARRFPRSRGSLYGAASNSSMAAFKRPPNRIREGLYLANGSAHPGGGMPLAALSGRAAAREALLDIAGR